MSAVLISTQVLLLSLAIIGLGRDSAEPKINESIKIRDMRPRLNTMRKLLAACSQVMALTVTTLLFHAQGVRENMSGYRCSIIVNSRKIESKENRFAMNSDVPGPWSFISNSSHCHQWSWTHPTSRFRHGPLFGSCKARPELPLGGSPGRTCALSVESTRTAPLSLSWAQRDSWPSFFSPQISDTY